MFFFRGFRACVSYRGFPGLQARLRRSYCQPHSQLSAPWQSQCGWHAYLRKHFHTHAHSFINPKKKSGLDPFHTEFQQEEKWCLMDIIVKMLYENWKVFRDWVKPSTSWQLILIRCWTHLNLILSERQCKLSAVLRWYWCDFKAEMMIVLWFAFCYLECAFVFHSNSKIIIFMSITNCLKSIHHQLVSLLSHISRLSYISILN